MTSLEIFLVGLFITAGIHRAWFSTPLPVHVFKTLRYLGWGAHLKWPPISDYEFWLRHECATWWTLNLPASVGDLLSCPVCISYHMSFWVALIMVLGGAPGYMLFAWLAWPELINLLPGHHHE